MNNYPPGVKGTEPQIVGYDDGPACSICEAPTHTQSTTRHGPKLIICEEGHVEEVWENE